MRSGIRFLYSFFLDLDLKKGCHILWELFFSTHNTDDMRICINHFKVISEPFNPLSINDLVVVCQDSNAPLYSSLYDTEGELMDPRFRKSQKLLRILKCLEDNNYCFSVENRNYNYNDEIVRVEVILTYGVLLDGRRIFTVGL
jgi:uncharacterized membrane protein YkgB